MEDGHEVGDEEGVDAAQVAEAALEAEAPHRDGEGPQGCEGEAVEKWETRGKEFARVCNREEKTSCSFFAKFPLSDF